jgi:ribokinase
MTVDKALNGRALPRLLVLGSANLDVSVVVERLPRPGETVLAHELRKGVGGKGVNQAIAAARTGAETSFLGVVGADQAGSQVEARLRSVGIDVSGLSVHPSEPTGMAFIGVEGTAENVVFVATGANSHLRPSVLRERKYAALIAAAEATVALTQGELALDTISAFATACADRGLRVILNLAPARELPASTLALADPLIVNEVEALALLGQEAVDLQVAEATEAADRLANGVARSAVITLGAAGAVASDGSTSWHEPAPAETAVVDTSGAGDAFVGAVAAILSRGGDLVEAVRWGVAAGSAAVGARGTSESYDHLPTLSSEIIDSWARA